MPTKRRKTRPPKLFPPISKSEKETIDAFLEQCIEMADRGLSNYSHMPRDVMPEYMRHNVAFWLQCKRALRWVKGVHSRRVAK